MKESSTEQRFLQYCAKHPARTTAEAQRRFFDGVPEALEAPPEVSRELLRPLEPWPAWIDPPQQRRMEAASIGLARLFRSLPRRLFDEDAGRLAAFLGMPDDLMVSLLLAPPTFLDVTLCRGDFIDTDEGLKLIEFNIGNLGGWQNCVFEPLYRRQPAVAGFLEEVLPGDGLRAGCRNTLRALLRHVVGHTLGTPLGRGPAVNLLVVASDGGISGLTAHPEGRYQRELDDILRELAPGRRGRIRVAPVGKLDFPGGEVHFEGERFHAIVEQNDTRPSRQIFRSFKAGQVNCYTSPLGMILSDKKLLALLSERAGGGDFDDAERKLVEDHLPWTRRITGEPLSFRGEEDGALEILLRHQGSLVLKAGQSFGGKDVHIGPAVSREHWRELASAALAGSGWVVQEHLVGRPLTVPDGAGGGTPRDVVWGLYVFGETFGGAFLRTAPQGETPVLNIGHGARISLAFEVQGS